MSEERMICEKSNDDFDGEWFPVEPAPPEDWRPFCYFNYVEEGGCLGMPDGKIETDCETCQQCPYRKRD
jgi:hypothetical protein